MKFNQKKD